MSLAAAMVYKLAVASFSWSSSVVLEGQSLFAFVPNETALIGYVILGLAKNAFFPVYILEKHYLCSK